MMKKFFVILTSLILTIALVGCGGNTNTQNEETELTFWCNAGLLSQWEERLAYFTEQTGIKVKVEGVQAGSWGELAQQIATSAYSGNLPDCGDLATEAVTSLVAADLLYPLDEFIERDKNEMKESLDEIDPILLNAHVYSGKTYSLPTTWNRVCLFFNKNVLAAAGVTPDNPHYPHAGWKVDDFLYCCGEITKDNIVSGSNNKYGYKIDNQYFLTVEPWLNAFGTSILNSDWTKTTINSDNAKECFQMLYDMMNSTDVKKQYSTKFGGTKEYDLFYANKLGFMSVTMEYVYYLYSGGFNNSTGNPSKLKDGYDVIEFPSSGENSKTTIGVGACPIFKTSKNKEAAWKLCKFISSKEFQEGYLVDTPWAIPSIRSAFNILKQKDFFPINGQLFYDALNNSSMIPAPSSYNAIELEIRRWFGGYLGKTTGFTLSGTGKNSLDTLAKTIDEYLED